MPNLRTILGWIPGLAKGATSAAATGLIFGLVPVLVTAWTQVGQPPPPRGNALMMEEIKDLERQMEALRSDEAQSFRDVDGRLASIETRLVELLSKLNQ